MQYLTCQYFIEGFYIHVLNRNSSINSQYFKFFSLFLRNSYTYKMKWDHIHPRGPCITPSVLASPTLCLSFLWPTKSSYCCPYVHKGGTIRCCPYVHGVGASHQSMGFLPVATSSREWFSFPRLCPLTVARQYRVELGTHLPHIFWDLVWFDPVQVAMAAVSSWVPWHGMSQKQQPMTSSPSSSS